MIQLQKISSTGKTCPKCGHGSVFSERIYRFLGFIYSHTIDKCEMEQTVCNYEKIRIEK